MRVLIIGGGASGMAAAIAAAEHGADVTVIEKKEQLGKKLLATGNGHCNLTNLSMAPSKYHGHDPALTESILARYTPKRLMAFFESLGLSLTDRNGYVYPRSMQASAVTAALSNRLKALGVKVRLSENVTAVTKKNGLFLVETDRGKLEAEKVILSAGSEAGVKDPKKFSAYQVLRGFGHRIYPVLPALLPLKGREGYEEKWAGVRFQGRVFCGGESHEGEILLTKDGISGIPVFELSYKAVLALQKEKTVTAALDFFPELSEEGLLEGLLVGKEDAYLRTLPPEEFLRGLLPGKIGPVLLKKAGLRPEKAFGDYSNGELKKLANTAKNFSYEVTGHGPLSEAQVAQGGLDTREVKENMESRKVPGLFVTGELLDIDGTCGGYNLHLAFSTGLIAGGDHGSEGN